MAITPIKHHRKNLLPKLKAVLKGKVKLAILFGSVLTDYFRKDSDVDLAVFFGKKIGMREFLDFKRMLEKAFDDRYEFDLVLLDTAGPIITMQALKKGELIYCENRKEFILFKARKLSEYADFKFSRRMLEQKIAEGSIYDG